MVAVEVEAMVATGAAVVDVVGMHKHKVNNKKSRRKRIFLISASTATRKSPSSSMEDVKVSHFQVGDEVEW